VNRLLFYGARLLDPETGLDARGDLLVQGDRIAAVGGDLASAVADAETVSAEGLCLSPGLVDMRVQLREPGAEHMESIESGGQAAAAGGITTMVALPNTEPPVDDVPVVEFLARRAREAQDPNLAINALSEESKEQPLNEDQRKKLGARVDMLVALARSKRRLAVGPG